MLKLVYILVQSFGVSRTCALGDISKNDKWHNWRHISPLLIQLLNISIFENEQRTLFFELSVLDYTAQSHPNCFKVHRIFMLRIFMKQSASIQKMKVSALNYIIIT